jgi:adenylate kinase
MLASRTLALDRVIYFDVSRPELLRRLTGRRSCPTCQATYHLVSAPPRVAGRCDKCGSELVQRADDAESAVANRLDVYESQTAPLLAYYRDRGLLTTVKGEGPMPAIADAIRAALKVAA